MLEKLPFSNYKQIYKEEFILPSASINTFSDNVALSIIKHVNSNLKEIHCRPVSENAYIGIVKTNKYTFALINVSSSDINHLKLTRNTKTWFVLPTEIINIGSIFNIPISSYVISLFTHMPELGVLYSSNLKNTYLLPDIGFTTNLYKKSEFQLLFGPSKTQNCFNFNKKPYLIDSDSDSDSDSDFKKKYAINRYALFLEDCLTNDIILRINDYSLFIPLSFHSLDNDILGKMYDNEYTIFIS